MEDVITGQEFSRATNMPARWLVDQASISAPVFEIHIRLSARRHVNPGHWTGAVTCHIEDHSLMQKRRSLAYSTVPPHNVAAMPLSTMKRRAYRVPPCIPGAGQGGACNQPQRGNRGHVGAVGPRARGRHSAGAVDAHFCALLVLLPNPGPTNPDARPRAMTDALV